jgi:hypothetical protein
MSEPELLFTVKEFCQQVRISKRHYSNLQSRGEGPKVIRLGRRVLIARETAKSWLLSREARVQFPKQERTEAQPGPPVEGNSRLCVELRDHISTESNGRGRPVVLSHACSKPVGQRKPW